MVTLLIDSVIDGLMATAAPSSGDNLSGFVLDADHDLFELSSIFTDRRIRITDDPSCLVVIEATVSDSVETIQAVSQALRTLWIGLAYADFQASRTVPYREATVLRFATYMARGNLFVTGRIVAGGGPYSNLAEEFERRFGKLSGPLATLPKLP